VGIPSTDYVNRPVSITYQYKKSGDTDWINAGTVKARASGDNTSSITDFTFTGLAPGTTYNIQIIQNYRGKSSVAGDCTDVTTKTINPPTCTATAMDDDAGIHQITVEITGAEGITSATIRGKSQDESDWSKNEHPMTQDASDSENFTYSYEANTLKADTKYTFQAKQTIRTGTSPNYVYTDSGYSDSFTCTATTKVPLEQLISFTARADFDQNTVHRVTVCAKITFTAGHRYAITTDNKITIKDVSCDANANSNGDNFDKGAGWNNGLMLGTNNVGVNGSKTGIFSTENGKEIGGYGQNESPYWGSVVVKLNDLLSGKFPFVGASFAHDTYINGTFHEWAKVRDNVSLGSGTWQSEGDVTVDLYAYSLAYINGGAFWQKRELEDTYKFPK
jgi:hypothetical protein